MSSDKKAITKNSSGNISFHARSLLNRLLVATRDFLDRKIDEEQLEGTAHIIKQYLDESSPTLAISSLRRKDLEKILKLKWTRNNLELAQIRPIQSPPALGKQPGT